MFISVDLPAPFSPRSACTSPRRRSKSTLSSATTPGKRLVIPRISRTVDASTGAILRRRAGSEARPSNAEAGSRLELRRNVQLAGDDPLLVRVHQRQVRPRDRVRPADRHAAVLEVEEQVLAAPEVAALLLLRRGEDAVVDALDAAREHALRVP